MVKKLIKHEFIYYVRTLCIFLPLVLFMGLAARITSIFYSEEILLTRMANGASISLLAISSIALLCFSLAIGVVRFYKNMYSAEGYLSFSLPVSNHMHILSKLLVAVAVFVVSVATLVLAWVIAFSENPFALFEPFQSLFRFLFENLPTGHLIFYIIEVALIGLAALFMPPLLFYACISLGQLAKKNRILLSIGVYYLHSVILQILSTVFMIVFFGVSGAAVFNNLWDWMANHAYVSIHIFLIGLLLVELFASALYYFVTLYMMNRKLNLE